MLDLFSLSGLDTVLWLHPDPHCNIQNICLKCLFIFLIETCSPTILFLEEFFFFLQQKCCRYLLLSCSFYILGGVLSSSDHCKKNFVCFLLWKAYPSFACLSVCVWMHVYIYFLLESRQYKEWKSHMTSSQLPVMNTEHKIKLNLYMLEDSIRNNLTFIEQQMVIKRIKPRLSC